MNLLAIAGSLRTASINAAFCRAAARLAPPGMDIAVYSGLGALPLFNPDLEAAPPDGVRDLRTRIAASDALLIASPEYAHGISGAMKNALDWLVSFEGFAGKPVALVNVAPRAFHAHDALWEVLTTMSATIVVEASAPIPLLGGCVTEEAMVRSSDCAPRIRSALTALCNASRPRTTLGGCPIVAAFEARNASGTHASAQCCGAA